MSFKGIPSFICPTIYNILKAEYISNYKHIATQVEKKQILKKEKPRFEKWSKSTKRRRGHMRKRRYNVILY